MNVGVCYAQADRQIWLKIEVPESSSVLEAVELSGLLVQYPEINLETQKVGIFGKIAKLDAPLKEGDRVEIYRKITADPAQVQRRRAPADGGDDDDD
jgi:putative ubiquitin-RnfH superfamily antitoxin RatB of RatAB toxin-antitoxin module